MPLWQKGFLSFRVIAPVLSDGNIQKLTVENGTSGYNAFPPGNWVIIESQNVGIFVCEA
jgi:hypothetical protein